MQNKPTTRARIVKYYTKQFPNFLLVRNHYDNGDVEWEKHSADQIVVSPPDNIRYWDSYNERDDANSAWIQWSRSKPGAEMTVRTVIKDENGNGE